MDENPNSQRRYVKEIFDNGASFSNSECGTLIGRITASTEDVCDLHSGVLLCFVDESGVIPCQIEEGNLQLTVLDAGRIVIERWSIISSESGNAVLQIRGPMILGNPPVFDHVTPVIKVASISTAKLIQHNRDKWKMQTFNICGRVESISQVNRVKRDRVFLISLDSDETDDIIDVLIKRPEFIHWQQFLKPEQNILMTNLRPTTLYKGETDRETKLFVVTAESSLKMLESIQVDFMKLEDVLADIDEIVVEKCESSKNTNNQIKLISYQGKITKVEDVHRHIYELDGKIRLYLTYVSTESVVLMVGTEIVVHNVHQKGAQKAPKIRLYACPRSCLKVVKFPDINVLQGFARQVSGQAGGNIPATLEDLDHRLSIESQLPEKFGSKISQRTVDFVQLCSERSSEKQRSDGKTHSSMVMEYLQHEKQSCPVLRSSNNTNHKKRLITLLDISNWAELTSKENYLSELASRACGSVHTKQLNDLAYWSYIHKSHQDEPCCQWLLCGMLGINKCSSIVELQDKTGSINCVVAPHENERENPDLIPGKLISMFQHGHLCMEALGQLIFIKKFSIICEQFVVSCYPSLDHIGEPQYVDYTHLRSYLVFSMSDVFMLKNRPSGTFASGRKVAQAVDDSASDLHKERNESARPVQTPSVVYRQMFRVIDRDTLIVQQRMQTSASLSFYATVQFLGPVERVDGDTINSISSDACVHQVKNFNDKDVTLREQCSQQTVLYFTGSMTKWFSTLHPGSHYWLSKRTQTLPSGGLQNMFLSTALPDKMQKAVAKTRAKICIRITADMPISMESMMVPDPVNMVNVAEQIPQDTKTSGTNNILSVTDILKEKNITCLVCIIGRIQSRSFEISPWNNQNYSAQYRDKLNKENEKLGVSVPLSKNLVLVLQDLTTPTDSINIYCHCDQMSYPLGLLPGTIVVLYKLEVKLSKKDRPYLNYTMVSSHWMCTSPSLDGVCLPGNSSSGASINKPLSLLGDIWMSELGSTALGTCLVSAFIQQIQRIAIVTVCGQCGSSWKGDRCSSERCSVSGGPVIQAKASCIVDDSTGTAMVYFKTSSVIAALLTLTPAQWHSLESEVIQRGSLVIYQNMTKNVGGDKLLAFLCELMTSPVVKRCVKMLVKRFSTIMTPGGDKHVSVHHFNASDFPVQSVDLGQSYSSIKTRSLPWLLMECLELKESNYLDYCQLLQDS